MSVQKPALDPAILEASCRSNYPEPYRSRVLPRSKRRLGDALGLTRIGINHTTLPPPGKGSSMRHWHTQQDEFVYVLEGEVVLRTHAGEQLLRAGMCAGFPAGVQLLRFRRRPGLESAARAREDDAPRRHALLGEAARPYCGDMLSSTRIASQRVAAPVRRSAKDTSTSLPT